LNGSLYDARAAEAGYPTMTTLTLRYRKGYFVVSGPDTQPTRFRSRREAKDWGEAKDWCHTRHPWVAHPWDRHREPTWPMTNAGAFTSSPSRGSSWLRQWCSRG